jgi:hypothetical protein
MPYRCALCSADRSFVRFAQLFRHVTLFHQHDPSFRLSCELGDLCGNVYKTFSAYKGHVYRHHKEEVTDYSLSAYHASTSDSLDFLSNSSTSTTLHDEVSVTEPNDETYDEDPDCQDIPLSTSPPPVEDISLPRVQKAYARFLLQLREEFLLPKRVIQTITSNVITLLEEVFLLVEHQHRSSSSTSDIRTADYDSMKKTIDDVIDGIDAISRSEYRFVRACERFFSYHEPHEIILSPPGAMKETAHYIPIHQTLQSLFQNEQLITLILDNVAQQRHQTQIDDDLLFSFRNGKNGKNVDENALLFQLYVDDVGTTNPIGPKKDNQKMTFIYFMLEDIPDIYRSQLDCINLLALCSAKHLEVITSILEIIEEHAL